MELKENERIEDLQTKNLKIIQNSELFRFGTDSILLYHFIDFKGIKRLADFGTGTGILAILAAGKHEGISVSAIELQSCLCDMARRSAELNSLSNLKIIEGDIKNAPCLIEKCDTVMCNPPYEKVGHAIASENKCHEIARFEVACDFDDISKSAAGVLKSGGKFYFVHRAPRFTEICSTLKKHGLTPKTVRFIHSRANAEAKHFLCCAVKGGREYLTVMPPLIVLEGDEYTAETRSFYEGE